MLQRRPGPATRTTVTEWDAGVTRRREDRLATEEPLELRVAWPAHPAQRLTVTMRTPGHDFELAAGLTYGEGLHAGRGDLRDVAYCTDHSLLPEQRYNVVTVTMLVPPRRPLRPRGDVTSACGVCGKQSLADVDDVGAVVRDAGAEQGSLAPHVLVSLPERLRTAQRVFARTGGLHAAGLYTSTGEQLVVREDVGRHNAVDKVIGHALLDGVDVAGLVLCVSGRVGFEIVQKAVHAGVCAIVAVGAPSSLAVQLAEAYGVTVAGFARGSRLVAYSHPGRLRSDPPPDRLPRPSTPVAASNEG